MPLAETGNSNENGGWISHVHFSDYPRSFDSEREFPGVALPSQQKVWTSICPDPKIILGLDNRSTAKKINYEEL